MPDPYRFNFEDSLVNITIACREIISAYKVMLARRERGQGADPVMFDTESYSEVCKIMCELSAMKGND